MQRCINQSHKHHCCALALCSACRQYLIVNPTSLNVPQIAASIEKNLIPRLSNSPPDIESLRLYLTLPESPLFCDRNNYVTIVIPFAKSIINLKDAALKVLGKMTSVATQMSLRNAFFLSFFLLCTLCAFASGNWWSIFEPQIFQRLVELYKEVVVYLLQMHKVGIPSVERRIFNSFLETALRLLEILHGVR